MSDRKEYELTQSPADSESEIREIDTCCYADEYVPRGYMRIAHVEENKSPTSCEPGRKPVLRPSTPVEVSYDERFENEKL